MLLEIIACSLEHQGALRSRYSALLALEALKCVAPSPTAFALCTRVAQCRVGANCARVRAVLNLRTHNRNVLRAQLVGMPDSAPPAASQAMPFARLSARVNGCCTYLQRGACAQHRARQ